VKKTLKKYYVIASWDFYVNFFTCFGNKCISFSWLILFFKKTENEFLALLYFTNNCCYYKMHIIYN
jgi:hypothetical protein